MNEIDACPAYRHESMAVCRNLWCDMMEQARFSKGDVGAFVSGMAGRKEEAEKDDDLQKKRVQLKEELWHFFHMLNTSKWCALSPYNVLKTRIRVANHNLALGGVKGAAEWGKEGPAAPVFPTAAAEDMWCVSYRSPSMWE